MPSFLFSFCSSRRPATRPPKTPRRRRRDPFSGGAAAAAWSAPSHPFRALRSGVSSSGQIHFILAHPGRFLSAIRAMVAAHFGDHVHEFVGQLGWLDVALPAALILLFLVVLALAALADKNEKIEVRWPPGRWVSSSRRQRRGHRDRDLYRLESRRCGGDRGVQGRYFIPSGRSSCSCSTTGKSRRFWTGSASCAASSFPSPPGPCFSAGRPVVRFYNVIR